MHFFSGFLFFHCMFIVSYKASFLSQKTLIFISKLHEHKFVFLLYLKKLRFLPLSLLMWFWCASFSHPVFFYVFFFYLYIFAFVCIFFCFLFFHCMFIISSKATIFFLQKALIFGFWRYKILIFFLSLIWLWWYQLPSGLWRNNCIYILESSLEYAICV